MRMKKGVRISQMRLIVPLGLVLALMLMVPEVAAQSGREGTHLQVGLAGGPGIGAQAAYIQAGRFLSRDLVFYVNAMPRFVGYEGSVQMSAGVGGSLRIANALRVILNRGNINRDFDVGLRFGPGLNFVRDETRADANQRSSLFLEPFVRYVTPFRTDRTLFIELAPHRPALRIGLWM
ncbi:MAG: hypothetical protein RhofKO_27940 [Rhodothermales bacterium]